MARSTEAAKPVGNARDSKKLDGAANIDPVDILGSGNGDRCGALGVPMSLEAQASLDSCKFGFLYPYSSV